MADERQVYYEFESRDEEIPHIVEMAKNHPDLTWACVHLAQGELNNDKFPLTGSDVAALANAKLVMPEVSSSSWSNLGLAFLQLQSEGLITLPVIQEDDLSD